ncbi:hypothetical protein BD414DRAFT_536507 [Trametes punicea]|nr:hypothetical protein BD414DRAFT_536507 [Trametes punicea]
MAPHANKHILLCPVHLWGHARGLSILAGRMVRLQPVVVTLCVPCKLYDRTVAEILSDIAPEDKECLSRIQMLRMRQGSDHLDPLVIKDHFLELWSSLCSGESVPGQSLDGTPCLVNVHTSPLSAMVFDCTLVGVMQALHKQRTTSAWPLNLHIYIWAPLTLNFFASRYRMPDILPFIEAVASREGISFRQAACALLNTKRGELMHPPGLPSMYDYEFEPQGFTWSDDMNERVFALALRNFYDMDGIITADAADYHPAVAAAYREFLTEHGKKLYLAGPLIPKGYPAPTVTDAGDADRVMRFMDQQVKMGGEKSVIYVSFGSLFWPSDPAKLVAALDLLANQKIPFIISRPSPVAKLPDDLLQRLKENPNVYVGDWLPQRAILDHPAIGWCLTHGGHNTIFECIHSGVPMIVWPITVDQAPNAVHLDVNLEIAYELLEVRTGVGLGIIHRTGKAPLGTVDAVRDELRDVLARAFGEDGAAKRARLLGVREKLEAAWSEHGAARKAVETFLNDVCTLPASTLLPDSGAAQKRQKVTPKESSLGASVGEYEPSKDYWYPDGNIVIVVQKNECSDAVDAGNSAGRPNDEERLPNIVPAEDDRKELPDPSPQLARRAPKHLFHSLTGVDVQDFTEFLRALETPLKYAIAKPDQSAAISLLRVAARLECEDVLAVAKNRLCALWSRRPSSKHKSSASDALAMITIGREYKVPEVLKRAFYELLRNPSFWETVASRARRPTLTVSDADLLALYHARHVLQQKWTKLLFTPPGLEGRCLTTTRSRSTKKCLLDEDYERAASWQSQFVTENNLEKGAEDPLRYVESLLQEQAFKSLEETWCKACIDERKAAWEKACVDWWNSLDSLFKLA